MSAELVFAIVFFASTVQSSLGFGFALISLPLLSFMLPISQAVLIVLLLGALVNIWLAAKYRSYNKAANYKTLGVWLIIGAITPIFFIGKVNSAVLEIIIYSFIIITAISLLLGHKIKITHEKSTELAVGLLAGVSNTVSAMNGPIVILFFENSRLSKRAFLATVSSLFFITNMVSIAVLLSVGVIHKDIPLQVLVAALCGVIAGIWVGNRLENNMSNNIFGRTVIMAVLAIATTQVLLLVYR